MLENGFKAAKEVTGFRRHLRRYKVCQGKVESPVACGSKGDSLASKSQRVEFRRVGPRGRAPGAGERSDEQICRGNDSLGRGALDLHRHGSRGKVVFWSWRATVGGEQAGVDA